jgi:cell wall-associated NlpC family hydrolase
MNCKKITLALLLSFSLSAVYATNDTKDKVEEASEKSTKKPVKAAPIKDPYLRLADDIQRYAKKFMSTRYVWGGTVPGGFDCSGLVRYCYQQFGMNLTQSSTELAKLGYEIPPLGSLPGDMIFFRKSSNAKSPISHVGLVVEVTADNRVKFIHAARNKGVIYSYLDEDYYKSHFASIKRVMDGLKNYKY